MVDGDHFSSSKFDKIFDQDSTQDHIFSFISPTIGQTIKGFNCTIFVFGQTGSGKTFTMFGAGWELNNPAPQVYYEKNHLKPVSPDLHPLDNLQGHGIIPKSVSLIFSNLQATNLTIYTSFLQIYNEKIYDLLQDTNKSKPLAIRENKLYGIFVEGLAEYVVQSESDCFLLLAKGDTNRAVRQTKLNHHSSRSHTIFQVLIETDKANKRGVLKKGKINFCDLAGSEKYDKENDMTTAHIREMTQINKSLTTLGKVIHELGKNKTVHVPYRDSKLTRLLQDSLGLTTKTILIATVSPLSSCIEETISTLKFADRAKQIMVKARKNEVSALNDQLVLKLQREIQHLKGLLNLKRNGGIKELQDQLISLKEENKKLKKITSNITIEEVEKLKQENKRLRIELQSIGQIKELGDAFIPDNNSHSSSQSNIRLVDSSPRAFEISPDLFCPICNKLPPCTHYSNETELPRSLLSPEFSLPELKEIGSKTTLSSINFHKNLSVRYKMKNMVLEKNEQMDEIKESENLAKEMKIVRNRLERIHQLDKQRKKNFKEQLEVLENKRKNQELLRKKKSFKKINPQDLFSQKKMKILNKLETKLD